MSTIDTSTWSPDSSLNTEIEGIPLNADASIGQTWQAIQMLMAALKGDTAAIELTINQPDGTTIVATNQTLTVVDNGHAHTIANVAGLQTALNGKAADSGVVHLSGAETVSGTKIFSANQMFSAVGICKTSGTEYIELAGGSAVNKGARLALFGESHSSVAGEFELNAASSSARKRLVGLPDGTLTWDGQAIQTLSDERLKTPLSLISNDVLDAWGEVQWGEFRYLDAVEAKSEAARLHLGLIAQRVKAVFEARGLDACEYGILCHEVRPATQGEEAVDLWTIRYAEALAMEAAFQRRRAERLEARIVALEEKLNG